MKLKRCVTILPKGGEMESSDTLHVSKSKKKRYKKKWLKLLLVLLLIAGAAAGGYYYRDKEAKRQLDSKQAEIGALNDKAGTLEKELETEKAKREAEEKSKKGASAKTLESIKAAINSGNTVALQSYMAPKIKVLLAASEGVGDRTPTEAIGDLKYVENAAKPWEFSLPASTLNSYRNGAYRQYFPSDAVVGKSMDNFVISFTFDDNGKIDGIFMASDASLLL